MHIRSLFPVLLLAFAFGCEEQMAPTNTTAKPAAEPVSDEVDTDALRRPGTGDYFGALAGAKRTAENTKDKIDEYNDDLDKKMDELFDE